MMKNEICDTGLCTGCGACAAICPKSSIQLKTNEIGAIQPAIDHNTCDNCNACRNICPIVNIRDLLFNEAIEAYYATSNDIDIYSNGASGGIATQLAYEVLGMDGVVYASVMDAQNIQASHVRITDIDTLRHSQKSKYVQSRVSTEIYKCLRNDVLRGQMVLFIGTPCQVGGVKKILNKEYPNALFVELICHGAPGEQVFLEYTEMEDMQQYGIQDIEFRDKKNFKVQYKLQYKLQYRAIPLTPKTSLYFHGFMSGSIYRESCHSCQYARRERVGDITLGDTEYTKDNKVYNSVIIYTEKGNALFNRILSKTDFKITDLKKMLDSHAQLNAPVPINDEQRRFVKYCNFYGIKYALKHMNRKKTVLVAIRKNLYKHRLLWKLLSRVPGIKKIVCY